MKSCKQRWTFMMLESQLFQQKKMVQKHRSQVGNNTKSQWQIANRSPVGFQEIPKESGLSLEQFRAILKCSKWKAEPSMVAFSMRRVNSLSTQGLVSFGKSFQMVMLNSRHLAVCIGSIELQMNLFLAIPN